jgi:hypothetical protein
MSVVSEVIRYEWRWAASIEDAQRGVAIKTLHPTFERILVLYRIERWESSDRSAGGVRAVLVLPDEIPIGDKMH